MENEKIIKLLSQNEHGTTIKEISSKLNIERHTLAKYLESLKSKGLISCKEAGRTQLWSLTKSPILGLLKENHTLSSNLKEFMKGLGEEITVLDKDHFVLWSTNKQVGKKCNVKQCKTCPGTKTLQTGKLNSITRGDFKIQTSPIKDISGKTIAFMEIKNKI